MLSASIVMLVGCFLALNPPVSSLDSLYLSSVPRYFAAIVYSPDTSAWKSLSWKFPSLSTGTVNGPYSRPFLSVIVTLTVPSFTGVPLRSSTTVPVITGCPPTNTSSVGFKVNVTFLFTTLNVVLLDDALNLSVKPVYVTYTVCSPNAKSGVVSTEYTPSVTDVVYVVAFSGSSNLMITVPFAPTSS